MLYKQTQKQIKKQVDVYHALYHMIQFINWSENLFNDLQINSHIKYIHVYWSIDYWFRRV